MNRGVFIADVFEFNNGQRKAVDEEQDIRATTEANRSVRKKQSALRSPRRISDSPLATASLRRRAFDSGQSGKSRSTTAGTRARKLAPGQLGLLERKFQGRRFVEFPQVKGKTAERVQLYTATDYHSIAIEFEDETSLLLRIEPGFTINAELQQKRKGNLETLAEWPPIESL